MKPDDPEQERVTGERIASAGPRPAVPEEDLAAIREAAREVWRDHYAAKPAAISRRRWLLPAAAVLTGGLVLAWWSLRPVPPVEAPVASIAARVERVTG